MSRLGGFCVVSWAPELMRLQHSGHAFGVGNSDLWSNRVGISDGSIYRGVCASVCVGVTGFSCCM